MSSMRNAVQRRNHKERGQPEERKQLGLLEKHKVIELSKISITHIAELTLCQGLLCSSTRFRREEEKAQSLEAKNSRQESRRVLFRYDVAERTIYDWQKSNWNCEW